MKRLIHLILLFVIITLTACKDDEEQYDYGNFRMDLATVLSPEEGVRFLRDDGLILLPETTVDNKYLTTGARLLLRYIPQEKISETEIPIEIQSITLIPEGDIIIAPNESSIAQLGNDPLYITSIWPGGGYINLRYKIEQNNGMHQFSLCYIQENQISPDTLYLDLRHKAQYDNAGYLSKSYASFSLKKVLDKVQSVKVIKINANVENLKQQYFIFNTQAL